MARSALREEQISNIPLTIDEIKAPAQEALEATKQTIIKELSAQVPMIETITTYLIERGGKRLRPTVLLLAAQATQTLQTGQVDHMATPILLATVVELIHSATLLHDDIVDESSLRRGQKTANANWGNAASVLAGDFLYSRAFQILARVADIPISQELATTTNQIAEGEMMQLIEAHKADMTVDDYWKVITLKTATLFECACRIGAMAVDGTEEQVQAMADFGLAFGIAYQIIDDTLDYQMNTATLGKDRFNDLNEGKMTLPLILTKALAPEELKILINEIMEGNLPSESEQNTIYQFMLDHQIFAKCHAYAQSYIAKAQAVLETVSSQSPAWQSLNQLSEFILRRDH
jgi:octaprenyl-diphosphate synthase